MFTALGNIARVTIKATTTTPTLSFTRDISRNAITWKGILTLTQKVKEECMDKTVDFCAKCGLDDLGADEAVIASGGFHQNPNDQQDKFSRITVLLRKNGRNLKLQGADGRVYDRIHIPQDEVRWEEYKDYFSEIVTGSDEQ